MEFVQKQLFRRIPPLARRSNCGVRLILLPYAEIAWDAWSSDMMNKMFGLDGVPWPYAPTAAAPRNIRRVIVGIRAAYSKAQV
jgi:hypothetical protein